MKAWKSALLMLLFMPVMGFGIQISAHANDKMGDDPRTGQRKSLTPDGEYLDQLACDENLFKYGESGSEVKWQSSDGQSNAN